MRKRENVISFARQEEVGRNPNLLACTNPFYYKTHTVWLPSKQNWYLEEGLGKTFNFFGVENIQKLKFFDKLYLSMNSGIPWPISFTKKIEVAGYFQKKNASLNKDIHPGDSWPYNPLAS